MSVPRLAVRRRRPCCAYMTEGWSTGRQAKKEPCGAVFRQKTGVVASGVHPAAATTRARTFLNVRPRALSIRCQVT